VAGHRGIIANPNCSTIIMVMAIAPLHRLSPIERIVVSTYQAASGAGARGIDALRRELAGETVADSVFPHRLASNLIPRIDVMLENGYTREEMKMVHETRKIMDLEAIPISATCVRVPVERSHSEAIQVTTRDPLSLAEIRRAFQQAPGVRVVDAPEEDRYPMPLEVAGEDDVYVGRLRKPPGSERCVDLWVVGDQLLKGAALNAVQIAELLFVGDRSSRSAGAGG
jgi:aspartate-semialdehyde dehydrogenase